MQERNPGNDRLSPTRAEQLKQLEAEIRKILGLSPEWVMKDLRPNREVKR
jgi:hypothetical protein